MKRRKRPYISVSDYKKENGKCFKKKFLPLRKVGKKAFFVVIFLGLGHWMDFPNVITLKNFVIMLLAAVTIFFYDEFGWSTDLSDVYDIKVDE